MKMFKLLTVIILIFSFLHFVNSNCLSKCICVSESDLRCFNLELRDYSEFVSLSTKRHTIYFYKSVISLSKLTAIMPHLTNINITSDCHVIDCFSQYKTHISGCNNDYNEGIDDNDDIATTKSYVIVNNTNVTWVTAVVCVLVILMLIICITALR
jgi:hypothetical protein